MFLISRLVSWSVFAFLGILFATVAVRLLNGEINVKGLLNGTMRGGEKYFSPERVQLLLVTLALAAQYLNLVLERTDPKALPPVPQSWIAVLGGSHAVYLGGKAYTRLLHKPKTTSHSGGKQ